MYSKKLSGALPKSFPEQWIKMKQEFRQLFEFRAKMLHISQINLTSPISFSKKQLQLLVTYS